MNFNYQPVLARDFFAAGVLMTGGGPRPTPGGTDYASTDQRFVRPSPYSWTLAPVVTFTPGQRSRYPLMDIQTDLTSDYGKSGPWYGSRQQNPMSMQSGIKNTPLQKVRG